MERKITCGNCKEEMEITKEIECQGCGTTLEVGDECWKDDNNIFCSAECLAREHGDEYEVEEEDYEDIEFKIRVTKKGRKTKTEVKEK